MLMHLPCYSRPRAHRLLAQKGVLDAMLHEPGGYRVVLARATSRPETPAATAAAV